MLRGRHRLVLPIRTHLEKTLSRKEKGVFGFIPLGTSQGSAQIDNDVMK